MRAIGAVATRLLSKFGAAHGSIRPYPAAPLLFARLIPAMWLGVALPEQQNPCGHATANCAEILGAGLQVHRKRSSARC
jgi:hypothetical protein